MPRRWVRVLVIVVAAAFALYIVGYAIFDWGGEVPGSGTGEIVTEPTP